MRRLLLLLAGLTFFLSNTWAETPAPSVSFLLGLGQPRLYTEQLSSRLADQGLSTIDPGSLASWSAAYGITLSGLTTEVVSTRTSNTLFSPPQGNHRTRLVEDTTEVTLGSRWDLPAGFFVAGGLGVGVTKLLLQTYDSRSDNFSEVMGATKQASLVSSWNWTPVVSARLGWKVFKPANTTIAWTVGVGVTGNAYLLPFQWKLNDDVTVTGIGTPWQAEVRPVLWMGVE